MAMPYTLEHNMGEVSFETIGDAIRAMYVIAQYDVGDDECDASDFVCSDVNMARITRLVESGKVYKAGNFALFKAD